MNKPNQSGTPLAFPISEIADGLLVVAESKSPILDEDNNALIVDKQDQLYLAKLSEGDAGTILGYDYKGFVATDVSKVILNAVSPKQALEWFTRCWERDREGMDITYLDTLTRIAAASM